MIAASVYQAKNTSTRVSTVKISAMQVRIPNAGTIG